MVEALRLSDGHSICPSLTISPRFTGLLAFNRRSLNGLILTEFQVPGLESNPGDPSKEQFEVTMNKLLGFRTSDLLGSKSILRQRDQHLSV